MRFQTQLFRSHLNFRSVILFPVFTHTEVVALKINNYFYVECLCILYEYALAVIFQVSSSADVELIERDVHNLQNGHTTLLSSLSQLTRLSCCQDGLCLEQKTVIIIHTHTHTHYHFSATVFLIHISSLIS